jgi:hypothetical protein
MFPGSAFAESGIVYYVDCGKQGNGNMILHKLYLKCVSNRFYAVKDRTESAAGQDVIRFFGSLSQCSDYMDLHSNLICVARNH